MKRGLRILWTHVGSHREVQSDHCILYSCNVHKKWNCLTFFGSLRWSCTLVVQKLQAADATAHPGNDQIINYILLLLIRVGDDEMTGIRHRPSATRLAFLVQNPSTL